MTTNLTPDDARTLRDWRETTPVPRDLPPTDLLFIPAPSIPEHVAEGDTPPVHGLPMGSGHPWADGVSGGGRHES